MTDKGLPVRGNISFEGMKQINEHGAEYWSPRDLQPLLGYSQWRRFEEAIKRAFLANSREIHRIIILPAPAK